MAKKFKVTPFQKFVQIESLSGILLFSATLLALILANSPLADRFLAVWEYKIGISGSGFELVKPLILWINDGLMAIFFFLIGLEIKRELLLGELNTVKKASLPLFAAAGGMAIPVILFFILNQNQETSRAWGIPMATDIAFSLAILKLLGKKVPIGLKIFLIAFAIVDDLGAVLVIALFYSEEIKWSLIGIAMILLAILFFLSHRKIYVWGPVLVFGIMIWVLFLKAGIHPTIAGVLLAFTIPIRRKIDLNTYVEGLCTMVDSIRVTGNPDSPLLSQSQIEEIDNLEEWTEQVQSPLQHLEHKLHNWVAYLIMPLFALSNSGVQLFGEGMDLDLTLSGTIALSLVAGKLLGISLFSWLGVKTGVAELPSGIRFGQIIGVALLAGVGFTMSIFVANLAFFDQQMLLDSSKVGILAGSLFAGLAGFLFLRFTLRKL
ncbi:MAG: Na+/H+ antiporter NhaA [Bacteroidales bacterium]